MTVENRCKTSFQLHRSGLGRGGSCGDIGFHPERPDRYRDGNSCSLSHRERAGVRGKELYNNR